MTKLPALWFFTDPDRTPDPVAIAQRLPSGTAVVYRHFGAADAAETAKTLRRIPGLILLIGADPAMADAVDADGVHLPERMMQYLRSLKRRRPNWIVTVAAHSGPALRRAQGADAAVLSPIFESDSASAGAAIGLARAQQMVLRAPVPVIGLGGVTRPRAVALMRHGFAGAAGVSLFLND